jgi:hypothetical protein
MFSLCACEIEKKVCIVDGLLAWCAVQHQKAQTIRICLCFGEVAVDDKRALLRRMTLGEVLEYKTYTSLIDTSPSFLHPPANIQKDRDVFDMAFPFFPKHP